MSDALISRIEYDAFVKQLDYTEKQLTIVQAECTDLLSKYRDLCAFYDATLFKKDKYEKALEEIRKLLDRRILERGTMSFRSENVTIGKIEEMVANVGF